MNSIILTQQFKNFIVKKREEKKEFYVYFDDVNTGYWAEKRKDHISELNL